MRKQSLLFISSFLLIAHTSHGALSGAKFDGDPSDPEGVPSATLPAAVPVPLASVHAGAGRDDSGAVSVLSDHGSDDEDFKAQIKKARDLGFAEDPAVKKALRGKRHQRKLDKASRAQAERDALRAAFLAEIGEPTAPKDELATAVAGAGVASAAGSARSGDEEHDGDSKTAGAKAAAPEVIDPAELSAERLAWRVFPYGKNMAQGLLHEIISSIELFPLPQRTICCSYLRDFFDSEELLLSTHTGGIYTGGSYVGIYTFIEVLTSIVPEDRIDFMIFVKALQKMEMSLTPHVIKKVATIMPGNRGKILTQLNLMKRKWNISLSEPNIDGLLLGMESIPAEEIETVIDMAYRIGARDSWLAKVMTIIASVPRDKRGFLEERLFQNLPPVTEARRGCAEMFWQVLEEQAALLR